MRGGYGSEDILKDCTVEADRGEIAVIVGPNGAGKSTAMKAIFGMLTPARGRHHPRRRGPVRALKPTERVRQGMSFVPQVRNVFPSMTVEENLEMGAFLRRDDISATMDGGVRRSSPSSKEKRRQPAGELSGGQRQQVAVGRALMTKPLRPDARRAHRRRLPHRHGRAFRPHHRRSPSTGIAVLMVEQNAKQALEIATRGYVLQHGQNAHTDTGEALLADPEVRRTFLGG